MIFTYPVEYFYSTNKSSRDILDDFEFCSNRLMSYGVIQKWELKDGIYEYQFVCPGVNKNDLKTVVDGDTIKIDKPATALDKTQHYVINLPENCDKANLHAIYENGILVITVPKSTYQRQIKIM
jgi:HSP20 family molecular chaperone IbpA